MNKILLIALIIVSLNSFSQQIPSGFYQREDDKRIIQFEGKQAIVVDCGGSTGIGNCTPGTVILADFFDFNGELYAFERIYNLDGFLTNLLRARVDFNQKDDQVILRYPDYSEVKLLRYSPPLAEKIVEKSNSNERILTLKPSALENPPKKVNSNMERTYFPVLPKSKRENKAGIGIIIGNRNYKNVGPVDYAENDADIIYELFQKTFGLREGNIIKKKNLLKSEFEAIFGTVDNPQAGLFNISRPESDVYIYYSGHGSVDNNGKTYLVPIELEKNLLSLQGYSVDLLFDNLSKLNVKSVTVFIDACFIGEIAYESVSPIQFRVVDPVLRKNNMVVLHATSQNQLASWDNENKHGLFTFMLIQSIVNYLDTDVNKDKKISVGEVFERISDFQDGVPYYARRKNISQQPSIKGFNNQHILFEY